MLDLASRLGYAAVAYTVTLPAAQIGDVQAQRSAIRPCSARPRQGAPASAGRSGPMFRALGESLNVPEEQNGAVLQLRRVTLTVADAAQLAVANQAARLRPGFDLVAIRPTSEEAFLLTCERGECDLISLQMDEKIPFMLRRKDVLAFLQRGGFFEVEFAPALRDAGRRRFLFANVRQLLEATRGGKGVFFSSAAADAMELRSPHDLANFASVLGFRGGRSLRCVSDVPLAALQRGALRRGFAQPVASKPRGGAEEDVDMAG
eukprot:TRINITY_DN72015_c0_g1_i1.p1 TRINITY_DN72015_c0_g1~~TRINITY_DN72015_c0_g1_i1.p1  ORF type:complete len:298 (+),score=76.27 TRINITY_DN72015_c0_g1_i1:111-896(+)